MKVSLYPSGTLVTKKGTRENSLFAVYFSGNE
jgi:hypothetical protein